MVRLTKKFLSVEDYFLFLFHFFDNLFDNLSIESNGCFFFFLPIKHHNGNSTTPFY